MAALLLDTDVYSYLIASNTSRAVPYQKHLVGNVWALSFITVGELFAGYQKMINKGEWPQTRMGALESRLGVATIIPYDIEICRTYGRIKVKDQIKNPNGTHRVVAPNDLWIATCAVRHSIKLVTNNRKHFENIPGLDIISEAP